jgi:polysaccharide biosynthesis PFTS motif protein
MIKNYIKNRYKSIISGKRNIFKFHKEIEVAIYKKKFLDLDLVINENLLRTYSFSTKNDLKKVLADLIKSIFAKDNHPLFPILLEEIYISYASRKYKKKFSLPLNLEIIKKIKKINNFQISTIKCLALWNFWIFYNFALAIKSYFFILYNNIKNFSKKKNKENSVYFDLNINYNELLNNNNNFHIIFQYIKKNNIKNVYTKPTSNKKIETLFKEENFNKNGVNFFYTESPIPVFKNFYKIISFSGWFFFSLFLALYDLLKGNWYSILLFNEILLSKAFSYASEDEIMNEYIFSYQGTGYRPLWTYNAENKNKKVSLFFYSTNTEPYMVDSHPQLENIGNWCHLSFNYFYAWNQFQKEIILKNISHRKISIEILGPMLFVINTYNKILTKNFILVFDITPGRFAKRLFYTKDIMNGKFISKFHKDIFQISNETKLPLIIRVKKDYNNINDYDKLYIRTLKNIEKNSNVKILDRENSCLNELISRSLCCISYPFTSTAIIANELNKPSIYYDPSKLISNLNRHIDHDIKTINDLNLLREWVEKKLIF